jgi:hypothetical protein
MSDMSSSPSSSPSPSPSLSSSSSSITATWDGLTQAATLYADVRTAVHTLKALVSTPAAVAGTGSIPASLAIAALGVQLVKFLDDVIDAIDDDIEGLQQVLRRYTDNEQASTQLVTSLLTTVGGMFLELPASTTGTSTGTTRSRITVPQPALSR